MVETVVEYTPKHATEYLESTFFGGACTRLGSSEP